MYTISPVVSLDCPGREVLLSLGVDLILDRGHRCHLLLDRTPSDSSVSGPHPNTLGLLSVVYPPVL